MYINTSKKTKKGDWEDLVNDLFGLSNPVNYQYDVIDYTDRLVLETPFPGYEKNQITIDLEGNILVIIGEANPQTNTTDGRVYGKVGVKYGKQKRSFQLPPDLDTNKITAKLDKGILSVSIPRLKEPVPKIKIN